MDPDIYSIRARLYPIMEVVLRVPPLFLMDSVFLGIWSSATGGDVSGQSNELPSFPTIKDAQSYNIFSASDSPQDDSSFMGRLSPFRNETFKIRYAFALNTNFFLESLFNLILFVASVTFFAIPTRHLLLIYSWILTFGSVVASYWLNENFVQFAAQAILSGEKGFFALMLSDSSISSRFLITYISQMILGTIYFVCGNHEGVQTHPHVRHFATNAVSSPFIGISYLVPLAMCLLPGIPPVILTKLPFAIFTISALFSTLEVVPQFFHMGLVFYNDIQWVILRTRQFGFSTIVEQQWHRLRVPEVLRAFWCTRVLLHAVALVFNLIYLEDSEVVSPSPLSLWMHNITSVNLMGMSDLYLPFKALLSRGCETMIATLGMTSVLSQVSQLLGQYTQNFLLISESQEQNMGAWSAVLFFVLALQTGLTGLTPEKRFLRLYRNACLLMTALMHFIHNIVSPLLHALSASRNNTIHRHVRALVVCGALLLISVVFLYYLWTTHTISTWLMAVSAFTIEVVIKVVLSLLIYALFLIDARSDTMWEKLDDYIYYIKAFGNTVEFIFGIFLFFNGCLILLFENGGSIRAIMMCIHAYFNIWRQAKSGWETFIKRRSAVTKIESLADATQEDLERYDDVCAICYQDLATAKITRCNHFFHGVCLRKWLYVQDICPLCHENLQTNLNGPTHQPAGAEVAAAVAPDNHQEINPNPPLAGPAHEPAEHVAENGNAHPLLPEVQLNGGQIGSHVGQLMGDGGDIPDNNGTVNL